MNELLSPNLTAQVANSLGLRIVSGDLKGGDTVTADALQEEYGVSRTVVREALKVLAAKGLVESRTKTGTSILGEHSWNLLDADVIGWFRQAGGGLALVSDLEELRENYEPWAARVAAERRSDSDVVALRRAYTAMVDAATGEGPDSRNAIEADLEFHQAILQATGNAIMIRLGLLIRPVHAIRNEMTLYHDVSVDFLEYHRLVLEAIDANNAIDAEDAMKVLLKRSTSDTDKLRTENER